MTDLKTKKRNKLKPKLLNAILQVKFHFMREDLLKWEVEAADKNAPNMRPNTKILKVQQIKKVKKFN